MRLTHGAAIVLGVLVIPLALQRLVTSEFGDIITREELTGRWLREHFSESGRRVQTWEEFHEDGTFETRIAVEGDLQQIRNSGHFELDGVHLILTCGVGSGGGVRRLEILEMTQDGGLRIRERKGTYTVYRQQP